MFFTQETRGQIYDTFFLNCWQIEEVTWMIEIAVRESWIYQEIMEDNKFLSNTF